jgi:hypothetical protein
MNRMYPAGANVAVLAYFKELCIRVPWTAESTVTQDPKHLRVRADDHRFCGISKQCENRMFGRKRDEGRAGRRRFIICTLH